MDLYYSMLIQLKYIILNIFFFTKICKNQFFYFYNKIFFKKLFYFINNINNKIYSEKSALFKKILWNME